jgi:transmembrane sensor
VALGDGSRIELEPQSRLHVVDGRASHVRLDLERGGARFDVTHVSGRVFEVSAGGLEVEVVGTRFGVRVGKDRAHVEVWVDRGAVEVRRPDRHDPGRRLAAGESLTVATKAARSAAPRPPTTPPAPPPETVVPPGPRPEPALDAGLPPRVATPRPAPPASVVADAGAPAEPPQPAAPTLATATAAQLFEMANGARRAGRMRDAAEAYDTLRRRFPGDSRAGLAAFELGRLRMDAFHDLPGAVEALSAAIRIAPGGGFREDAMARVVQAYDVMGAAQACVRARDRYLASYPGGAQAAAIRARCGVP